MSDQTQPSNTYGIVLNPDGTITRTIQFPETSVTPDPTHPTPVLSKEIPLNQSKNTSLRIFLPREALDHTFSPNKLPLVVFLHGGGFVLCTTATTIIHDLCVTLASELHAVIVSIDYRLAPEHRLPAAYDDTVEALYVIKNSSDEWLIEYADFGNCFLMGSSAGGNIAYYAGLHVAALDQRDLEPVKIQGLILHHPFFGGSERTRSELRLANDPVWPLSCTDMMWDLGLPIGVDRDHEYSNPMVGGGSKLIERMRLLGWRILVLGCDGDLLIDRQMEMAKMLEEKGVNVKGVFREGGSHVEEVFEPSKAKPLCVVLKNFILSSNST